MRRKMLLIVLAVLAGLMTSCDSNDDYCSDSPGTLSDLATRRTRANSRYTFILDVYGNKYKTFLVLEDIGYNIGETAPFYYYDTDGDGYSETLLNDYTFFNLIESQCECFYFGDEGLEPSIWNVSDDCDYIYDRIVVGETVTVWASEEKYTNRDLYLHAYDTEYYEKVSKSFKCCYKTILKEYTQIDYNRLVDNEWSEMRPLG